MSEPARTNVLGDSVGRYQLLVQIGHGGMGEVFLGRLRGVAGFAKLVVIKRMHSHLTHDKRFVDLFVNEGRVVAQLSHPNICQVHELGEQDGSLFLVMEYLSGVPWEELSRTLPRGTPHELPLVAGVLAQACDGLHHAHQLRDRGGKATPVVHRDVSPQNLFVTTDGICKVLDFGVAKISTSDRYSQSGLIKGKLPYMAPEQIRGQPVDARTDVFAMGVVLWESLTGTRLFSRSSDYLIWKAITEEPIPPVAQLRPDLPPVMDAIVRRALQRPAERRYQSMQELAQELRAAVPPLDHAGIAQDLRALCAEKLAETSTIVTAALDDIDLPPKDRSAPLVEVDCAETLHSGMLPSVMLREESYLQLAAPDRRRRRWPYLVGSALVAAAIATAVMWGRPPSSSVPSRPELTAGATPAPAADPQPGSSGESPRAAPGAERGIATGTDAALASDPGRAVDARAQPRDPASTGSGSSRSNRHHKSPKAQSQPVAPTPPDQGGEATAVAPPQPRVGLYSVDSRPYATISIDGAPHGETPLYRIPLSAGSHQVRAVRADGTTKSFSITIVAGKEVSSGQLKW